MPIATRLTNTGTMLVNGSFNEQSLATGSLYFNQATTSRITFSGNANYALGTGDFTCECFIWIDGIGVGNRIIIETGTDATAAGLMTINSTTLGWGPANGTVLTFAFGTQNLSTWYHVAITRSSGTLRAFINGTQSATAGQSDTNNYTQNALYVGSTEGNAAARRWPGYLSNLRLIKGTALYTSNFAVPPAPLTAVTNTVFLMTMPFYSTTASGVPPAYLDTSSIGASPSAYDTTNAASIADVPNSTGLIPVLSSRLTSTQYSAETLDELTLDAGSISFSGAQNLSGNYTAFQQFTDPFTVEAWIYPTVVGGVQNSLWNTRTPDVQDAGWDMFIDTNGKLVWGTRNVRYVTGTTTLTVNTWSYVTLVRSSTTSATLYLNGVSQGTATVSGTQNFTNSTLTIGGGYTGRLTNFRLVKGVAVYSGAFTPPQSILSAVTGTSLLLNVTDVTNFITDGSSNNFTVTNTGTAVYTVTSPFNATVTVPSLYGSGSLSFNGTSQFLTVTSPGTAFSMGTGDFTIEAWIYVTSTAAASKQIFSNWQAGANSYQFYLRTNNRLVWQIYTQNSPDVAGLAVTPNTWTHVAWSKSGTVAYLFINGVLSDTTTGVTNSANGTGSGPYVGGQGASEYFPGYITNLRVIKGTARYTSSFTLPTAPLTAVSGTSLLLNVSSSSAYITDSSTNNFTMTNNNAVAYSGTLTPLPGTPSSRQLSDGTLQVTNIFDEFTGAPVVDTSLQLWLDSGQTASYPGSGTTWTDLSGQSNTGTLNNSPTFSPTVGGGTFLFNGTNQTATTVSLNLQQNFTLEAWVNQNVLNGFAIFGQGTQATNNGLHILYTANTTIRFGMYGNDTDFTVSTSTGIWYHMIFTYNHSSPYTKGFYLNAVVQAGSIVSGPAAYTGSGTFRLGATYSTAGNFGNGYFEGVKMYNRILTADEITTNFNALRGRFGI